jgi:hypothetical protein
MNHLNHPRFCASCRYWCRCFRHQGNFYRSSLLLGLFLASYLPLDLTGMGVPARSLSSRLQKRHQACRMPRHAFIYFYGMASNRRVVMNHGFEGMWKVAARICFIFHYPMLDLRFPLRVEWRVRTTQRYNPEDGSLCNPNNLLKEACFWVRNQTKIIRLRSSSASHCLATLHN